MMTFQKNILLKLLITTVLFSGLLVGCRSLVFGKNGMGDHWMDKTDNDRPVVADRTCGTEVVFKGDYSRIQLKSNPTSGYVWHLTKAAVLFEVTRSDFVKDESVADGDGKQVFMLRAKQVGVETLRFEYMLKGEKDGTSWKVRECRVRVVN
jgi:predicted secreted protein